MNYYTTIKKGHSNRKVIYVVYYIDLKMMTYKTKEGPEVRRFITMSFVFYLYQIKIFSYSFKFSSCVILFSTKVLFDYFQSINKYIVYDQK